VISQGAHIDISERFVGDGRLRLSGRYGRPMGPGVPVGERQSRISYSPSGRAHSHRKRIRLRRPSVRRPRAVADHRLPLVIWDSPRPKARRLDAGRCWVLWVGASRSVGAVRARRASRWTTRRASNRTAAARRCITKAPHRHARVLRPPLGISAPTTASKRTNKE